MEKKEYDGLKDYQIKAIKTGSFEGLSDYGIKKIPEKYIVEYIDNGGREFTRLSSKQLRALPKETFIQCVTHGLPCAYASMRQKKFLTTDMIAMSIANGGSFAKLKTKQIDKLPRVTKFESEYMNKAVTLYKEKDGIKKEDLPTGVFMNSHTRRMFIEVSRNKAQKNFNAICNKYGWEN